MRNHLSVCGLLAAIGLAACGGSDAASARDGAKTSPASEKSEVALLAGGCFWCIEGAFDDVPGVIEAVSGYTGGQKPNPTYEAVSSGETGHFESVSVRFDPSKITYAQILDIFWRQIDPTDPGGQFADRGSQYRTAIFVDGPEQRRIAEASKAALEATHWFDKPIATLILPAGPFYRAEEYHQAYCSKHRAEYLAYKWGSGRGSFIERTWESKPPIGPAAAKPSAAPSARAAGPKSYVKPSAEELHRRLTPLQYDVTQNGATEPPFDNAYWNNHEAGIYVDVVSGEPLFSSTDKFDSGTGWPSFSRPLEAENVVKVTHGPMVLMGAEVKSRLAGSHLGDVFLDGPPPSGLRYCIDSASLRFVPLGELEAQGFGEYAKLFKK